MRMIGWLLNLTYAGLLGLASPWILWRSLRQGRYRRGWPEKLLGRLPVRSDDRPLVWLHAVSVGEVLLLRTVLARLQKLRPELQLLISTSTDAGFDVARARLSNCEVTWLPLDFTWATRRALQRVRPDLFVLVELELWPNLIAGIVATRTPLVLINGRLSDASARGYGRLRSVMRQLLSGFTLIDVQNDDYRERFLSIGAPAERVSVSGSIKFDGVVTDPNHPRCRELRRRLGISATAKVFIAGSTQFPEEAAALDAWESARPFHPELRLILVPRHPERFDEVASLVRSRGWRLLRRSATISEDPSTDGKGDAGSAETVILIDTVGELSQVWGLADVAFVGGSLTPGRGGQNMLEPAGYGAAVLFGPHTENFRSIVGTLLASEAAIVVGSAGELAQSLRRLLANPAHAQLLGQRARQVVLAQQGATDRIMERLLPLLPQQPSFQSSADRAA